MTGSKNISCYIHACIVAPPRAGDEVNGHPRASVLTQRNSRAKGSVCLNTTCSNDITRQTESREYWNLNRSSQNHIKCCATLYASGWPRCVAW